MILVIAEQRGRTPESRDVGGGCGRPAIAAAAGAPVAVAVAGSALQPVAAELSAAAVSEVVTIDDPALASYTADGYTAALQSAVASLAAGDGRPAAHLPDARFRAEAGRPAGPRDHHRCDGREARGRSCGLRPADVPGEAGGRRGAAGTVTAFRDVPDRRVPRGPGVARRRACAGARAVGDRRCGRYPAEARGAVPGGEQSVDLSQAERIVSVGPRHQGAGEHRDRAAARRCARRGAGGVAADLRRGLAADGAAGRQLGPDGRAEALCRAWHLRRDPAPGRA